MRTSNVRAAFLLVGAALLSAACAGTPQAPAETQAIRDYISVAELQDVDSIRTQGRDAWGPLTEYFAIYEARDGRYLLEFSRVCQEMFDNTRITPDRRYDHNVMRRGIDTLRGCRIDGMYPLTEAQATEIEVLANPPASGN